MQRVILFFEVQPLFNLLIYFTGSIFKNAASKFYYSTDQNKYQYRSKNRYYKLKTEPDIAAAFSVVANTTFSVPTVALLLNNRNKPAPKRMVPAAVPPASKATP